MEVHPRPRVSVAIATYGRAAMVRQAVEAALTQTLPPLEIVVSDDASIDHTLAILDYLAYSNPSVRVLRQEHNSGGVGNWNAAMNATRGDFLAWCSDDDRFLEDHLEASLGYLEAHPDVGMVHSGFVDVVEDGGDLLQVARPHRFRKPHRVDRGNLFGYLMRYYDWPFHPSTLVMRRAVWERTGLFDPAYALADTDWFVRAAERFRVVLLPRHGVFNRRHAGNWSNRLGSARMQKEIFSIVEQSVARLWPRNFLARIGARALWRANVRLRLLLTARARILTGHAEAACAAWHQVLQGTGRNVPVWLETAGVRWIHRQCELGQARLVASQGEDQEQRRDGVSPL